MSKVRSKNAGYTIVEAMIFLAVSGGIFLSAVILVNGQQRKSEFNVGIRDIQSQILDVMNDVSTGYYDYKNVFTCNVPATSGKPVPSSGSSGLQQGANGNCTFVGKVIQFAPDNNRQTAVLHTLVGRRQAGNPAADVRTLTDAAPRLLDYDSALDNTSTVIKLPNAITIEKITHGTGPAVPAKSVAFVTKFAGNAGAGGITGTQDIELIPIKLAIAVPDPLTQSRATGESDIDTQLLLSSINPSTGVTLCFKGGTGQYGIITLGGANRQLSSKLTIGSGNCP